MKSTQRRAVEIVVACAIPLALSGVIYVRGRDVVLQREMSVALSRQDYASVKRLAPLLQDVNVSANNGSGYTPLILTLMHGDGHGNMRCDINHLRALLEQGADVNYRAPQVSQDSWNEPVLTVAATLANVEAVRLLLARGADVNARDRNGRTALTLAVWRLQDCARYISPTSSSPERREVLERQKEVVRILKRAGAKP